MLGGFLLAQAAILKLLQHGGGSLFFTGSSGSLRGKANFAPFAAAKAALRNLAQSIAREYGPQNIHIGHIVVDDGQLIVRKGEPEVHVSFMLAQFPDKCRVHDIVVEGVSLVATDRFQSQPTPKRRLA